MARIFDHFSRLSRDGKNRLFASHFDLGADAKILDVGGQLEEIARMLRDFGIREEQITSVNLDPQHVERIRAEYPRVHGQVADARNLPFADDEFDAVYSNAVIEHVGGFEDQQAMAKEIMRVGKRWFVTTPNRWFPFEFHMRVPFVHWLPRPLMLNVGKLCSYNHVKSRYQMGLVADDLWLLSKRQMKKLFPNSKVIAQRVTFWPETLIAIGPAVNGS